MKKILIVGTGFSGAVVAEQLAKTHQYEITMVDERSHIAGNCHTERDTETGIMEHKYGPHIFHTSNQKVWEYINSFGNIIPFINRVKSSTPKGIFSLPINLHTINQFFNTRMSPSEAKIFINKLGESSILNPENFEEQALKFIGKDLYYNFFYGYTKKQWGTDPKELPASILKRLPIRFNYDDNYYNDLYQGIPENGYSDIIKNMLDSKYISIKLNEKFKYSEDGYNSFEHIFFTGPIDEFFEYRYGRLGYRTVTFDKFTSDGDFQGNAVINYPSEDEAFTRIHEHKHFTPWEDHKRTIYFKEYSKETTEGDIPYYPKRLKSDLITLEKYQADQRKFKNITFLGRLATYRYLDMHHIIEEALEVAYGFLKKQKDE